MKKWILILLPVLLLAGCGGNAQQAGETAEAGATGAKGEYTMISAEEAKKIMDTEKDFILLDVRSREEFETSHIPGAILIPDEEIYDRAERELPDKDQLILIYCRSGRRSKLAAEILVEIGYTNIKEFGGINDWPYDTE